MTEGTPLLIRAGTVIVTAGEPPRHEQGILVENGRIQAVDDWAQFSPDGLDVLDLGRYTVMPGLIDAHTHVVHSGEPGDSWTANALTELPATTALKAARHARRHLDMGVTTIRDVGARDWVDIALRDAIHAGWQPGPRMLVAGHGITASGGHMDARKYVRPGVPTEALGGIGVVADSPDEARRAAWEQLMRGADLLKLNATLSEYVRASGGQCSPELTYEAMQAVCNVAHDTGRRVAAHCHGGPGVTRAIEAGVDTFEHGRFLTDEQMDLIAARGRYLVPTLSPEARRAEAGTVPENPGDRRWMEMATATMYKTVERAHRLGVPIVAGTDAAMPGVRHGEVWFEMLHLAQAGLSTADVLAAATCVAATALGLSDEVGQVCPGLAADLIAVDGDPLRDLRILGDPRCIAVVMRDGRVMVDRRG